MGHTPLSKARAFSYHLGESPEYLCLTSGCSFSFSAPHSKKCVKVGLFSDKDFYTGVFCFRLRIQWLLDNDEVKPLDRTKV